MITRFVRGVDILKQTRQSGENQVQCVISSPEPKSHKVSL